MNKPVDIPVLLVERDGDIAVLVLNRPQPRNSLSEALLKALSAALTEIKADRSIRAVVLAANGPAFCAGHDLKELTARRADPHDAMSEPASSHPRIHDVVRRIPAGRVLTYGEVAVLAGLRKPN